MIRNKSILILSSLLLLGVMTLIDTRHFYLENEELVEIREVEREELKERSEGKDWINFLSGETGLLTSAYSYQLEQFTRFHFLGITRHYSLFTGNEIAFFLMHCCLKIHLG